MGEAFPLAGGMLDFVPAAAVLETLKYTYMCIERHHTGRSTLESAVSLPFTIYHFPSIVKLLPSDNCLVHFWSCGVAP